MARYWFGQSPADWTMNIGSGGAVSVAGGVTVTMWTADTGGIQVTDLLDASGSPITQVTSATGSGALPAGTIPRFQGPDETAVMWADAGGGVRYELRGDLSPLVTDVAALASDVENVESSVDALATVASTGEYDDLIGVPVLADVAFSGLYSDLDGTPGPGIQYVLKTSGTWPTRATTAPDPARPAVWIGAEPAPSAGGAYALEGDTWWPTP